MALTRREALRRMPESQVEDPGDVPDHRHPECPAPLHVHWEEDQKPRHDLPATNPRVGQASPTPASRISTHIFQGDDVGVLPIPQKNLNLF